MEATFKKEFYTFPKRNDRLRLNIHYSGHALDVPLPRDSSVLHLVPWP